MRANTKSSVLFWVIALALPLLGLAEAQAGDRKFEARLIWATNEKKSPDEKHKAVDPDIRERLGKLPLKWENYFEVNRQQLCVDKGGTNRVPMSPKCTLEVNMKDAKKVEVLLIGKDGKVLSRQTQPLAKGELLILGGEAPNSTAWLVTVKRTD
jgi:hypothetical protein